MKISVNDILSQLEDEGRVKFHIFQKTDLDYDSIDNFEIYQGENRELYYSYETREPYENNDHISYVLYSILENEKLTAKDFGRLVGYCLNNDVYSGWCNVDCEMEG